jgi:hypothetical protein
MMVWNIIRGLGSGLFGVGTLGYAAYLWWTGPAIPWPVLATGFLALLVSGQSYSLIHAENTEDWQKEIGGRIDNNTEVVFERKEDALERMVSLQRAIEEVSRKVAAEREHR